MEAGPLVFSLSGWVGSQAFGCPVAYCEAYTASSSLSYLAEPKSHIPLSSTVEILLSRQKKAELLKKMTDVAVRMSEEQLVELRADNKHFVSERKYDKDLGRVARFTCDIETLKKNTDSFGQVSHPKNSYSTRSCCSSVASVF